MLGRCWSTVLDAGQSIRIGQCVVFSGSLQPLPLTFRQLTTREADFQPFTAAGDR